MPMTEPKTKNFSHRVFLGAHRYTTIGGTARPADSSGHPLRTCADATTEREGGAWLLKT